MEKVIKGIKGVVASAEGKIKRLVKAKNVFTYSPQISIRERLWFFTVTIRKQLEKFNQSC